MPRYRKGRKTVTYSRRKLQLAKKPKKPKKPPVLKGR